MTDLPLFVSTTEEENFKLKQQLAEANQRIAELEQENNQAIENAFIAGFKVSGEGFNGELPYEVATDEQIKNDLRGSIHYYIAQLKGNS